MPPWRRGVDTARPASVADAKRPGGLGHRMNQPQIRRHNDPALKAGGRSGNKSEKTGARATLRQETGDAKKEKSPVSAVSSRRLRAPTSNRAESYSGEVTEDGAIRHQHPSGHEHPWLAGPEDSAESGHTQASQAKAPTVAKNKRANMESSLEQTRPTTQWICRSMRQSSENPSASRDNPDLGICFARMIRTGTVSSGSSRQPRHPARKGRAFRASRHEPPARRSRHQNPRCPTQS